MPQDDLTETKTCRIKEDIFRKRTLAFGHWGGGPRAKQIFVSLFSHFLSLSQNATGVCRMEQGTQTERQTDEMCRKAGYCPSSRGSPHCRGTQSAGHSPHCSIQCAGVHYTLQGHTAQCTKSDGVSCRSVQCKYSAMDATYDTHTHTCSALCSKYMFQCIAVVFDIS